jgi:hypothetical protein
MTLSRPVRLAIVGSLIGLGAGLLIGFAHAAAPARDAIPLAPHRAIYDLKLEPGKGKGQVEAATGRIAYDFAGSSCEGYTIRFRQVTEFRSDGKTLLSELRTTSFEDGASALFRFATQAFMNGNPTEASEGTAERAGPGISVKLAKPEAGTFATDRPVAFPTDHLRRVLDAARAGQTVLDVDVYDGSETGRKIYNTLTVIGRPIPPTEKLPTDAAANRAELAGLTRWQTTISYFEPTETRGEQMPVYQISFELYENGLARDLLLDYGDFAVRGSLSALEIQTAKPCR